jgi:hypothetical protein
VSWRTPITLLVLLGVVLGAGYYGWRTLQSPTDNDGDAPTVRQEPKCKKQPRSDGRSIKSTAITVNVFNAGNVSGLASATLRSLGAAGFRSGVADNAPVGVAVTNVTILTRGKTSPQAQLVASQFKGRVDIRKGLDLAEGIDVVVGDEFVGVDKKAKSSIRVGRQPQPCKTPA